MDGRAVALKVVYRRLFGATFEQVKDYTNTLRDPVRGLLSVRKSNSAESRDCARFTPSSTWLESQRNTHQDVMRARSNHPNDCRIRGHRRLFTKTTRIRGRSNWFHITALPLLQPVGRPRLLTLEDPFKRTGRPVQYSRTALCLVTAAVTSDNPNTRCRASVSSRITRGYQTARQRTHGRLRPIREADADGGTASSVPIPRRSARLEVGEFGCAKQLWGDGRPNYGWNNYKLHQYQ